LRPDVVFVAHVGLLLSVLGFRLGRFKAHAWGAFHLTELDELIGLQLVDSGGTAVPADEERQANLSIASGTGQFEKWSVKFDSEKGYAAATFIPTAPGAIKIVGTTLYLQDQSASFTVTMSFSLLLLCAVGGTLGGLVSYLTKKPAASWPRIFYWANYGVGTLLGVPVRRCQFGLTGFLQERGRFVLREWPGADDSFEMTAVLIRKRA
jgi:hypothetical protein